MEEEIKNPNFKVELSIYDWHRVLKQLEFIKSICNHDQEDCIDLWEQISTQLNGSECVMYGSKKHRKLDPEKFKIPEPQPINTPETQTETKPTRWVYKLFGNKK